MRSWIIGNSADCDVVVDSALASARHCQLTESPEGFLLTDLGSTNGTYVNGMRIVGSIRPARGDSITLGRTVPFPWPAELTTSLRIGRLADNDIVIDDARVSGHHARLIVVAGFRNLFEDLGSSNGTFLNSAERRLSSPTAINESDTLYFGTLAVPAAQLLAGVRIPIAPAPALDPLPAPNATEERPEPGAPPPAMREHRWLLAWMVQAPVLAVLIALALGRPAATANWQSVGQGIASTTFALALAAIWLGGSLAVVDSGSRGSPIDRTNSESKQLLVSFGNRLVVLIVLSLVACALLLAVVHWGCDLSGHWLTMCGVLALTMLIALFLASAVSALIPQIVPAASALLVCFAVMTVLGGRIIPVPTMSAPVQLVAEAMPSRWAFEALLLLETAQPGSPASVMDRDSSDDHDLVEAFFRANSERMGVLADAMALGSMLIGLGAILVFISVGQRSVP